MKFETPEFHNVFEEFKKHRKKLRKPMTDYAEYLILKKLDLFSNGNQKKAIEILDQSIEEGWQGIFPLKLKQKMIVAKHQEAPEWRVLGFESREEHDEFINEQKRLKLPEDEVPF